MTDNELLKATIMDAKERKQQWLQKIPTCNAGDLDTVMALTEALALVELRAQHLYLCSLRSEVQGSGDGG